MAYTPNHLSVYIAAYSGALAGMTLFEGRAGNADVSATTAAQVAGAWAQEVDTIYGPGGNTGSLFILEIQQGSSAYWSEARRDYE